MNVLKLTIALIVCSFGVVANAKSSKTMCLPIKNFNDKVTIQALCDATEFNKKYNLEVDADGCALLGQGIQSESAFVLIQAPVKVTADTEEELQKRALPTCEVSEAGLVIKIELQPWQQ